MKVLRTFVTHDFLICLFLTVLAAIPRLVSLDTIPLGFHGDEAWTGLDALQILSHGLISPYVGSATGQPTGPLYLTAIIIKIFGPTIFSVRLSMAIFGIVTVSVFYILARLFFNKSVSFILTLAFGFSLFHLHFSRLGFMVIASPLFTELTILFLYLYEKKKHLLYFFSSAVALGTGMYSYNTFILFVGIVLAYVVAKSFTSSERIYRPTYLIMYISVFLIIAFPLVTLIVLKPNFYFGHHYTVSIFNSNKYLVAPLWEKINIILQNSATKIFHFIFGGRPDGVDGYGAYHNLNVSYLVLFLIGILIVLRSKRAIYLLMGISTILIILLNSLTIDGDYRRNLLILPFIFIIVGIAVQYIYSSFPIRKKHFIFLIMLGLVVIESMINLYTYFYKMPSYNNTEFVFKPDQVETLLAAQKLLRTNEPVYFYSQIWSCQYETVRFLYGNRRCIDKSLEFTSTQACSDITSPSTVVLLNGYTPLLSNLKTRYPQGWEKFVYNKSNSQVGIIFQL
ncbi:MAG: glycosyltransferase family 39 protein [bacterium]|nr:glycosyltransferase family 39 protein [bacterium]